MSIDYTTLLGLTPGIQVAQADYDFTRDGGGIGLVPINSAIVPSGSLVLGGSFHTTTAFTFTPTGVLAFWLGSTQVGGPAAGPDDVRTFWWYDLPAVVTDADRALVGYISNAACLSGKCTVRLFYLPT